MTLMTYDPDQRLLFSPRIMPFLCLYPWVLSFPGSYLFFSILSSWMSCYISEDITTLSTADKKRERKVNPPTDWVYHPPSSPFVLCLLYTIPPQTPSLPAVVPHRLQPYPPTLCPTSSTGTKKSIWKKYHTMFLYVYIQLMHNPHMTIICKCL